MTAEERILMGRSSRNQNQLKQAKKWIAKHEQHQKKFAPLPSMAQIIDHIAEPLVEEFGLTAPLKKQILTLCTVAWNITQLPVEFRDQAIEATARDMARTEFADAVDAEARTADFARHFRFVFETVAERREQLYPDVCRIISNVHFGEMNSNGAFTFDVMHSPTDSMTEDELMFLFAPNPEKPADF